MLRRKFSRCGIQDATKLFCQMTSGIYFYPVVHYVRMDRSISRVAASRVWADVPAISREIALCVTHWDGTVRAFVVSDDLLATARIALNAGETQGSSFNYRHRSTVFMVAELSLPKVQPYSLSATPMRYIPLLPPEPLPLFSGVYPDRIYIAYGDLLFFSTIPVTVSTFTGDASPQRNLLVICGIAQRSCIRNQHFLTLESVFVKSETEHPLLLSNIAETITFSWQIRTSCGYFQRKTSLSHSSGFDTR